MQLFGHSPSGSDSCNIVHQLAVLGIHFSTRISCSEQPTPLPQKILQGLSFLLFQYCHSLSNYNAYLNWRDHLLCCNMPGLSWWKVELLYTKYVFMVEEAPSSFSPFSLADCTLLSHFSFNDFITIALPDLAEDPEIQIYIFSDTSSCSGQYVALLSTLLLIVLILPTYHL